MALTLGRFGNKDHVYTNYYRPEDPNKKKKQLIFGGVILFIFLSVLSLVITTREDPAKIALIRLAALQTETLSISDKFYKQLGTVDMRRNDAEMRAILLTNNFKLGSELRRVYKIKSVPGKTLKSVRNPQVYTDLEEARQLTHLDDAYAKEMVKQLNGQIAQVEVTKKLVKSKQTLSVLDELVQQSSGIRGRFAAPNTTGAAATPPPADDTQNNDSDQPPAN